MTTGMTPPPPPPPTTTTHNAGTNLVDNSSSPSTTENTMSMKSATGSKGETTTTTTTVAVVVTHEHHHIVTTTTTTTTTTTKVPISTATDAIHAIHAARATTTTTLPLVRDCIAPTAPAALMEHENTHKRRKRATVPLEDSMIMEVEEISPALTTDTNTQPSPMPTTMTTTTPTDNNNHHAEARASTTDTTTINDTPPTTTTTTTIVQDTLTGAAVPSKTGQKQHTKDNATKGKRERSSNFTATEDLLALQAFYQVSTTFGPHTSVQRKLRTAQWEEALAAAYATLWNYHVQAQPDTWRLKYPPRSGQSIDLRVKRHILPACVQFQSIVQEVGCACVSCVCV
jgi:hypothetical protein